jgi:autotransporter-associated beta strand protein
VYIGEWWIDFHSCELFRGSPMFRMFNAVWPGRGVCWTLRLLPAAVVALAAVSWAPAFGQTDYYANTVVGQSPVAYWRLNETSGTTAATVVGGSGLNGNYVNITGTNLTPSGPAPAAFPGFESGNVSKRFLGLSSNMRVVVDDQAALDITGELTLSTWVNLDMLEYEGAPRGLVSKWLGGGFRSYSLNVLPRGSGFNFNVSSDGNYSDANDLSSSSPLSANTWYHVAAVYVPGSSLRIYQNGVQVAAKTTGVAASLYNSSQPLWVGATFDTGAVPPGLIDEPVVFNAALSAQAVRTQYTAGVFSGTSAWKTAGSGSWGSGYAAAWTSGTFNGAEVNAAPGTFAGVTNADTAIFGTAVASGTATVSLDGVAASLRTLAFSNTSARYVIATGTGAGSLTLASPSGSPVVDVNGLHEISAPIFGSSGLQKVGAGTLILSGSSTFTGETSISGGSLLVNGALGNTAVTVASGAILGGSGVINGPVNVLSGGIVAPGNSFGTLTVIGGYSLANDSILNFEFDPTNTTPGGGFNDLITGVTDLTLDGILNISGSGDWTAATTNSSWRLFDYSGTLTNNTLSLGSTPSLGGGRSFEIDTSTANQVNLVIVPEPKAILLAGIGIVAAGYALRRREEVQPGSLHAAIRGPTSR